MIGFKDSHDLRFRSAEMGVGGAGEIDLRAALVKLDLVDDGAFGRGILDPRGILEGGEIVIEVRLEDEAAGRVRNSGLAKRESRVSLLTFKLNRGRSLKPLMTNLPLPQGQLMSVRPEIAISSSKEWGQVLIS